VALAAIMGLIASVAGAGERLGLDERSCHGRTATVVGTAGNDRIGDLHSGDVVVALAGDDRIQVVGGTDIYACGNGGDDVIATYGESHPARTIFDGGAGADLLGDLGEPDVLRPLHLIGGPGPDRLYGVSATRGHETLFGGGGDDEIYGRRGADEIRGGGGNDVMRGEPGNDRIKGGRGDDLANGGSDIDRCDAERERRCER
jgi:Ca2+-binding RTX toxin-like protein